MTMADDFKEKHRKLMQAALELGDISREQYADALEAGEHLPEMLALAELIVRLLPPETIAAALAGAFLGRRSGDIAAARKDVQQFVRMHRLAMKREGGGG